MSTHFLVRASSVGGLEFAWPVYAADEVDACLIGRLHLTAVGEPPASIKAVEIASVRRPRHMHEWSNPLQGVRFCRVEGCEAETRA